MASRQRGIGAIVVKFFFVRREYNCNVVLARFLLIGGAGAILLGQFAGSAVCAGCHGEIASSYAKTGMARSSGWLPGGGFTESLERGAFRDARSGVGYRVTRLDQGFALDYGAGQLEMPFFVGSGGVGRSYLWRRDGFLFQSPVSYYSATGRWNLSPGFENSGKLELGRAVEPACLQCHATGLRPLAGTVNGFEKEPFAEGGVGCERCHGPGGEHVRLMKTGDARGRAAIVHPGKLASERKDGVCAQCHLTGAARIARAGATPYSPGARFADSVAVFVWEGGASDTASATSHFERFFASACRKKAGEKMWCGTCHDPHKEPAETERAGYFDGKCRSCHAVAHTGATGVRTGSCIGCHMPKAAGQSLEHTAFTDHSIPRMAAARGQMPASGLTLTPFQGAAVSERDMALGYASVAGTEPLARPKALQLLARVSEGSRDIAVLSQYAQALERSGQPSRARGIWERVLAIDPAHAAGNANLGSILAAAGERETAVKYWERALAANPGQAGVLFNLGQALLAGGDRGKAVNYLRQGLEFDPGNAAARRLLLEAERGGR